MDALQKARDARERSLACARKALSERVNEVLVGNATGRVSGGENLASAREQLRASLVGWQYVAIRAIAQRAAKQRLFVADANRRPSAGRKALGAELEPLDIHPLLAAFDCPNEFHTRSQLLWGLVHALEATGRAYLWIRDFELWPLPPHWVTADHTRGAFTGWLIKPDHAAEAFALAPEAVCAISLPDPSNPLGSVSPLASQSKAINADNSLQSAQAAAFEAGIYPKCAITIARNVGPDGKPMDSRPVLSAKQRHSLIDGLKKLYDGSARANEPFVIDGAVEKIEPLSTAPREMDFLESGAAMKSRIFQAFGVNPYIVGELTGGNRAQAVVAEQSFLGNVINPLLVLLSESFTKNLAPQFASDGERLVCWFEVAEANDAELDLQRWKIGLDSGAVTMNEFRTHVLNLPVDDYLDVPPTTQNSFTRGIEDTVTSMLARMGSETLAEGSNGKQANGNGHNRLAGIH